MVKPPPLVTIGIPTFNRLAPLRRAVESALSQHYAPLEVVIFDNASVDGTQAYCMNLVKQDDRVRYYQQLRNVGAVANFDSALRAAQGAYFMWLGDDDWIDPNYVSTCVSLLEDDHFVQLVAGQAHYYVGTERVLVGEVLNVTEPEPWIRVANYYRQVRLNGVIYGVARTAVLLELLPLKHTFGRDWIMAASLACKGGIRTLTDTTLHRTVGGMSSDPDLLGQVGLATVAARLPYSNMLANVCSEVIVGSMFSGLKRGRRISLAAVAGSIVLHHIVRVKVGAYRRVLKVYSHELTSITRRVQVPATPERRGLRRR